MVRLLGRISLEDVWFIVPYPSGKNRLSLDRFDEIDTNVRILDLRDESAWLKCR